MYIFGDLEINFYSYHNPKLDLQKVLMVLEVL